MSSDRHLSNKAKIAFQIMGHLFLQPLQKVSQLQWTKKITILNQLTYLTTTVWQVHEFIFKLKLHLQILMI